ncbi:MAG TPA: zinc-finger domain-containing protein [Bacillus bacterium]|uniref:Zinc-finger domain-containing protein n=1 Tax=Siminovitchia fordii TaxID=254759 RepID=A0ABQ4K7F4_9BACI|nr:zinc-finger domain-containing protein [Siminovitchia fordii]GIN21105.1 zinc-finger domain-containing protein [Siminovitchia fordii]HBZ09486.1 zinc-finger domain-containing protein [Bacillus sp. (in: firmicutes)]
MNRSKVMKEINDLLEKYCEDCFLKKHFRKEFSKSYAHHFCIKQCTVGDILQKKGELLIKTIKG